MGQNTWAIFDDDRKALQSTLRKCIADIRWILFGKLSSRLIIFYLLRTALSCYGDGPSFSRYRAFQCGCMENMIKNRSYAHIRAKLRPPRPIFWLASFSSPPRSLPMWAGLDAGPTTIWWGDVLRLRLAFGEDFSPPVSSYNDKYPE